MHIRNIYYDTFTAAGKLILTRFSRCEIEIYKYLLVTRRIHRSMPGPADAPSIGPILAQAWPIKACLRGWPHIMMGMELLWHHPAYINHVVAAVNNELAGTTPLWLPGLNKDWGKLNTLRPTQNGRNFADDTFKRIFVNKNVRISIKISLKFVPKGLINNIPALVQIMTWRRPGDKPLSEPVMVNLLTHICVTRPQCVNLTSGLYCHLAATDMSKLF